MAHDVKFSVPERPLANKDIAFDVRTNGKATGSLKVSKGGVVWRPRDAKYGYKLSWGKLAELAEQHGREKSL